MNLIDYENYFENEITARYNRLNDFYHIDMFEFDSFINDLRGGKFQTPFLALESYNIGTIAHNNDNIHDAISGALVIPDKFDHKRLSKAAKTSFLTETEEIIKQVRAKMLTDSMKPCHLFHGLLPDSISICKTNVIADNYQGFRMQFSIESPDNTELSEDRTL